MFPRQDRLLRGYSCSGGAGNEKCKRDFKEAGTDFENVVKTTCFLAEMDDFTAFNGVYEKYFTGKPARSCVAVKELLKSTV